MGLIEMTSEKTCRILLLEDSPEDAEIAERKLRQGGIHFLSCRADSRESFLRALEEFLPDLVLADYALPSFDGLSALAITREKGLDIPFIIVSGRMGEEAAVAAMKAGAQDYLVKGSLARLSPAVMRELKEAEMHQAHKRLEAQLLQSQKMETVGTLAGGIAHDLNNQLTPVKGYIDLILQQTDPKDPNYELLTEVNQSVERCTELVGRLMNFSRPSAPKTEPLSFWSVFHGLSKLLEKLLPSTIRIEVNCGRDIWPVMGDQSSIEMVFMNLAVNARDAMTKEGVLSFEARNIVLTEGDVRSSFKTGPYVLTSVKDTGMGIPVEIRHRIFEPFFSTKKKNENTGLGLTMVFKSIKEHEGWIDVSSEVSRGTIFQIYFPAAPGARILNIKEPGKLVDEMLARNETILFADDEAAIRNLGKQFLERLGYKILLAADSEEAVRLYKENRATVDALVLDMTMPKFSGRQMLRQILELNPKAKVIVASGYTSEGTSEDLIQLGAKKFLQKPYTIIPLAKTLRSILD